VEWTKERMNDRMNKWMNYWRGRWVYLQVIKWMNYLFYGVMDEWGDGLN